MIENINDKIKKIKYEGNYISQIFCSKQTENEIEIKMPIYGGDESFLYNLYSETFIFCKEFTEEYFNEVECTINISKNKIHQNERDWYLSTITIKY